MFKLLTFITYPILKFRLYQLVKRKQLTTLCFHNVSPKNDLFYPHLHPKIFDQLCSFYSKHFEVVNFISLEENKNTKKPLLVVSFDDAYMSYYEFALPILEKYQLTSLLNVITICPEQNQTYLWQGFVNYFERIGEKKCLEFGKRYDFFHGQFHPEHFTLEFTKYFQKLDKERIEFIAAEHVTIEDLKATPMMSWNQIIETSNRGHEIGAHTHQHFYLDSLNKNEITEELTNCKTLIESRLNKEIKTFTFPGSKYRTDNHAILNRIGFKHHLLVDNKTSNLDATIIYRYLIYGKSAFRILLISLGIERLLRGNNA